MTKRRDDRSIDLDEETPGAQEGNGSGEGPGPSGPEAPQAPAGPVMKRYRCESRGHSTTVKQGRIRTYFDPAGHMIQEREEPIKIRFRGFFYETDDPNIQAAIAASPFYGRQFWEVVSEADEALARAAEAKTGTAYTGGITASDSRSVA